MNKVKLLVDHHLSDVKTIADIASFMDIHPETLRRVFLRKEKIHLGDYIMRRKVDAMKEHLLVTDDPCYDVCYSVGLREDSGAKIFRKFSGVTMQEFREKYKPEFERLRGTPADAERVRGLLAEAFSYKE